MSSENRRNTENGPSPQTPINPFERIQETQRNANRALHDYLQSLSPQERIQWIVTTFNKCGTKNDDATFLKKEVFARSFTTTLMGENAAFFFCFFSDENRELTELAVESMSPPEKEHFWEVYAVQLHANSLRDDFYYDDTTHARIMHPGVANYFTVWYLDQQFRDLRPNLDLVHNKLNDVSLLTLMRLVGYFDKKHPYYVYTMSHVVPHVRKLIDEKQIELPEYVAELAEIEVNSQLLRLNALRRFWPDKLLPNERTYAEVNKISLALAENAYGHLEQSGQFVPTLPGMGFSPNQIFVQTFQESASKHVIKLSAKDGDVEGKAAEEARIQEMNYAALTDADIASRNEIQNQSQRQGLLAQKNKQTSNEWRRITQLYRGKKDGSEPFAAIVSSEEFKILIILLQKFTLGKKHFDVNWQEFLNGYQKVVGQKRWEQVRKFFGASDISALEQAALLIYTAAEAHSLRTMEHKDLTRILHTILAPALEAYTPPAVLQTPPATIEEDVFTRYSFPVQLHGMKSAMQGLKIDNEVESMDSPNLQNEMKRRQAIMTVLLEKVHVPTLIKVLESFNESVVIFASIITVFLFLLEFFDNLRSADGLSLEMIVPSALASLATLSIRYASIPTHIKMEIESKLGALNIAKSEYYKEIEHVESQIDGEENKNLYRKQVRNVALIFSIVALTAAASQMSRLEDVQKVLLPPPVVSTTPTPRETITPTRQPEQEPQQQIESIIQSHDEYPPLNGEFETFVEVWSIEGPIPAGYFKDATTEVFSSRSTWRSGIDHSFEMLSNTAFIPGQTALVSRASAQGEIFKAPVPPGYTINHASTFSGATLDIRRYQDGTFRVISPTGAITERIRIGLVPTQQLDTTQPLPEHLNSDQLLGEISLLPANLQDLIVQLRASGISNVEKAERVRTYITSNLRYSLDPRYNAVYLEAANQPGGFVRGVLRAGAGDCDVSNTAFVAILRAVGVPARMAYGYANGLFDQQLNTLSSQEGHGWAQIWTGQAWIDFDGTPGNIDAFSQAVFNDARNVGTGQVSTDQFSELELELDPKVILAAMGLGLGTAAFYTVRRIKGKSKKEERTKRVSKEYRQIDYALHLDSNTLRACETFMLYLLNDFQGKTGIGSTGEKVLIFPMGWKTRQEMINALTDAILTSVEMNADKGSVAKSSLQDREDIGTYFNSLAKPNFQWSTTHTLKDETYYRNVVKGYEFMHDELERKINERFPAKSPAHYKGQLLLRFIDSLTE
ncbi:transglutaminase domain-containing protein [Candidatus Woesebacteria bacterium]|nr:transglutaminase domain-containing protein [Candidatus Woesebacteria bacterium]